MKREEAREKATALVLKMTLEEKMSQMRFDAPAIERLGVPTYNWWNEALHGVARAGQATMFPQAIAMGATFDRELLGEEADVIATEGRAKYNAYSSKNDRDIYKGLTFWSPNVNIFRDPRWGRGQETYGEDPYLTGELGATFVEHLQGEGEHMKAAACAKHFAVHSGPEALRHEFDAKVSPKDLHETYLPAFEKLVKEAKVEAVMGAYNRANGEACCASPALQKILRTDWGFKGHFVSDCWAIRDIHEHHHITATAEESAALAANNGTDVNCGNTYLNLMQAYRDGLVTEEVITESVVRLFTTRYLLGLFEGSEYDSIPYEKVECEEHLQVAERAAAEGAVLLKNEGILPLSLEKLTTIGVIGPNANDRDSLIGNYYGTSSEYITILEGVKAFVKQEGAKTRVLYSEGCATIGLKTEGLGWDDDRIAEAQVVAEHSDVVLLCLGLNEHIEGEEMDEGNHVGSGDKLDIELPESQKHLLAAVLETGKPVVVILTAGSDLNMAPAKDCQAILSMWYPGARGGKVTAEILFGKKAPTGKLPITFYESTEELPAIEEYAMEGRTYRYMKGKAQYPFGFGLTYGKLNLVEASLDAEGLNVEAVVENPSQQAVTEVVQVYAKLNSPDAPRNARLVGFTRVTAQAGEKKTVSLALDPYTYTVVNAEGERVPVTEGTVYCGFSAPDERSVELMGVAPIVVK